MENVVNQFSIELLCVTDGENGAILVNNNYESDRFKLKPEKIVDTVGAGDAFAAILCVGYLNKHDFRTINKLANEFAGEIVKVKGALPDDDNIYEKYRDLVVNE